MRKALLVIAALLVPLSGLGSAIVVPRTRLTLVSNDSVRLACNGRVDTACTNFEAAALYCVCVQSANGWSAKVRISAQPHTFLSHGKYRLHEMTHIFDFEADMRRHAAAIEAQSFTAQSECEAFVAEQHASFPRVLQEFVRASMLRRDGTALPNRQ